MPCLTLTVSRQPYRKHHIPSSSPASPICGHFLEAFVSRILCCNWIIENTRWCWCLFPYWDDLLIIFPWTGKIQVLTLYGTLVPIFENCLGCPNASANLINHVIYIKMDNPPFPLFQVQNKVVIRPQNYIHILFSEFWLC